MKYIYIIALILIPFIQVNAQNKGKIIYRTVTEMPQLDKEKSDLFKSMVKELHAISSLRDSLFFNLDYNNNESLFYLDRNKNVGISNRKGYNSIINSAGSSKYYKDYSKKLLIEQINSDKLFLITSKLDDFEWVITKESKKIGDYLCYKATTIVKKTSFVKGDFEQNIEAWYCPEISINLGPKNYGGLPGLILELKEGNFTYYVYSMNFKPEKDALIKEPIKGEKISRDDFNNRTPQITKENFKEYIGG